jgi:DNA modification methylase
MRLYHERPGLALWQGDATDVADHLAPGSVQAVVTSPPYWGLRDYGHAEQLGQEADVREYVANLVVLLGEVRKVLADDGVLWLNLGDTYNAYNNNRKSGQGSAKQAGHSPQPGRPGLSTHLVPNKSLVGVPWRVALELIDDGWVLRSDVVWAKPNPMPESVRDRPTRSHEYIFMLTKGQRYYYDADAVAEPVAESTRSRLAQDVPSQAGSTRANGGAKTNGPMRAVGNGETRNRRDVWAVPTRPFRGAHFATFPPELPRTCILASSRPGDLVLDPFSGSGTTGMVALEEGRRYVGIDLNADYLDLSLSTRLKP